MSVKGILREIEAIPSEQRWGVLEGIRRPVEPDILASFKGMEQIKRGEGIEIDDALRELDEPRVMLRGTRCGAWMSAPTRFTVLDTENMTISLTDPFPSSPCEWNSA